MLINRQRRVPVAAKSLEDFIARVQKTLRLADRAVTVCLVSDEAIARMNWEFRRRRGPTDVLSFPGNGRQRKKQARRRRNAAPYGVRERSYLGDIAISPETAQRNARRHARALPQELRMLILHGMLHLAGHDHETDRGNMDRLERRLRRRLRLG